MSQLPAKHAPYAHVATARKLNISLQQYLFVLTYVASGCKSAGNAYEQNYNVTSRNSSDAAASKLLRKDKIQAALEFELERRLRKENTNADYLIEQLMKIVDDPDSSNSDKRGCVETIGKYLKMWSDKHAELTGGITINMDMTGSTRQIDMDKLIIDSDEVINSTPLIAPEPPE